MRVIDTACRLADVSLIEFFEIAELTSKMNKEDFEKYMTAYIVDI
jgi:hypothetical protein